MTADTENKSMHCLLCNSRVGVSTRNSCPIFQQNVTTSDRTVAATLGLVLNQELTEETVHSDVVCKKCLKLLNEVDSLEERLAELRMELSTNYNRTLAKRNGEEAEEDLDNDDALGEAGWAPDDREYKPQIKLPLEDGNAQPSGRGRKKTIVKRIIKLEHADGEQKENEGEGTIVEEFEIEYDAADVPEGAEGAKEGEDAENSGEGSGVVPKTEDGQEQPKKVSYPQVKRRRRMPKKRGRKPAIKVKPEETRLVEEMVAREDNQYVCLVCTDQKVMGDDKTMTAHMRDVHEFRLYVCDICGAVFRKRTEMSLHLDEHVANEQGDFQCEVCNRIFSNLRLFRIHKRMHYPSTKLHTCETCGKRYSSRNLLEEHINTHTGARPYVCQCGKSFASKYTYKAHVKIHESRPRPYACTECDKTFLTSQNLTQHLRTHSEVKNFICKQCGKGFGTARNLEVHAIVHTGFKPFICRMCGKAFARKAEIRDHERTHTGEKPYQCEFCGATFSQRSNLQSHKRATHYDDKRYKCTECTKAFKRRRLLDYHMKAAHTGERPYKCNTCDATFVYPEHFKKHRRIHTGEKPYHCEVCGKAFNSRDNRNAHRFVHSDKKPYECLVCGMGFMRKPLLYNHMQSQGHLNDTIVVNQPRLTTEEDIMAEGTEEMEMTIVGEDELQGGHPVYIAELKDHVIIQEGEDGSERIVLRDGQDLRELTEHHIVTEGGVGHLIIDGQQVQFADASDLAGIEHVENEAGETFTIGGHRTLVVPATPHMANYADVVEQDGDGEVITATIPEGEGQTIDGQSGPVHLVQIKIPTGNEKAWLNIVPSS